MALQIPMYILRLSSVGGKRTGFRRLSIMQSKRIFSQNDVNTFSEISGDRNPIHIDTSANNRFGTPIVHGTLILGHVSGMLATAVPGALLLNMDVAFKNYLHVEEEMDVTVRPAKLQGAVLHLDMAGTTATKEIFNGTLHIGITKSLLRKIRTECPELVNN